MNPTLAPLAHSNPVHVRKLLKYVTIVTVVLVTALGYVYLKNRQFALGEEIRQTEKKIRQLHAVNDVLLARVTELSSRCALQRHAISGFISVVQITGDKIARLAPPTQGTQDGILRTAFNEARAQ
jgi:cell division protein FtsB